MVMIAVALAVALQDSKPAAEWNKDWAHRRRLELRNLRQNALAKGTRVTLVLHPEWHGYRAKMNDDFSDLRLVHDGKDVAYERRSRGCEQGKCREDLVLSFALPAELGGRTADGGYYLYYGNPAAAAPADVSGDTYLYHLDLTRGGLDAKKIAVEDAVKSRCDEKGWIIDEVNAGAGESNPVLATLRKPSVGKTFHWQVELDLSDVGSDATGYFGIEGGMSDAAPADEETKKKIEALIKLLGDDDFEKREAATKDLIAAGRTALAALREASRSDDLEVSHRAKHCIEQIGAKAPSKLFSLGVLWNSGQTCAAGTLASEKERPIPAQPIGRPSRVTLDVFRQERALTMTCMLDRSSVLVHTTPTCDDAAPEDLRLAFYGDAAGRFPALRVRRVSVALEASAIDRPQFTLDVEENRP